jgi:hypothetical protein
MFFSEGTKSQVWRGLLPLKQLDKHYDEKNRWLFLHMFQLQYVGGEFDYNRNSFKSRMKGQLKTFGEIQNISWFCPFNAIRMDIHVLLIFFWCTFLQPMLK